MNAIDKSIEKLTELVIREDFKEKETKRITYIKGKKTDLIKFCIKLLKEIKEENK